MLSAFGSTVLLFATQTRPAPAAAPAAPPTAFGLVPLDFQPELEEPFELEPELFEPELEPLFLDPELEELEPLLLDPPETLPPFALPPLLRALTMALSSWRGSRGMALQRQWRHRR